ncbi:ATP synthase subunit I [Desulfococcus multivorans]|uniref:ATP synthase I chain n=2 Tax=Desulfococcaceae TaxID=2931039 RepID=S7TP03_DESML|nr:ATP synthase subunit alpha (ATP synthase F0 sector subunit alpha) [Desulfococcus multivorans]AQV00248.1 ATP synthase subunit I [Desulfococcus multivorans]EPR38952.1 ATP synthase I chain [Desulfococcus multivorans DSM 2059]SJZ66536.1 ATP synthase I chain [Desulfococcus multivorans DSM 2059]
MKIQERLLKFVTRMNWILLVLSGAAGFFWTSPAFAGGIICGGLIVTVNFHLLYRTLKKAFVPNSLTSHHVILAKYYVRFLVSGLLIFVLIFKHIVNPIGLFIGLSVVVVSITLATLLEFKNLLLKEAV